MIVIGLVGRIGAGKSTVARMFADRGAAVIDADALAHAVLDEPASRAAIEARFGRGVVDAAGHVARAALAERVFGSTPAHAAARADLEAIVHPAVRRRVQEELARLRADEVAAGPRRVVVLDVPLLMQAGWDGDCDRLVVVECDGGTRRARLAARGWSPEQIAARDQACERAAGRPLPPKKTSVVDAGADPAYTRAQVDRIWAELPSR